MNNIYKTASLIMVFGLMLLMVFCISAFGAESEEQTNNDLLDNYRNTHQKIIVELEHAKKNVAEIFQLMQELNRLGELITENIKNPENYKKYSEKQKNLSDSLYDRYGLALVVSSIHFPDFNVEKESLRKIEKVMGDTISVYRDTSNCFNHKTYSGSKTCNDFKKICRNYGSDNGDMYYYELTKELELKKIDVSENDPDLSNIEDIESSKGVDFFLKDTYQFCRLLSLTSSPFSPDSIRNESEMAFLFIEDFYGSSSINTPSRLQKICIDGKPSEQRVERLLDLESKFPENWTIKNYYAAYIKWEPACNAAAQQTCKNTYVVKDQIILTYETVACKNREVAKEDIENDIRWMDSHADKLNHSILLDKIDICQKANDNGFFWFYEDPKVSQECKKEAPKTPKKRK